MNDHAIQKIIADKIPCYFISPHLDDAVFSAGGLIAYLSRHTQVEIVTVFTSASPRPYTFSATQFLKQCAYADVDALFADRRNEDRSACAIIGITPVHLGHTDALWRKVSSPGILRRMLSRILPEFLHAYPTYRLHIIRGGVSRHDKPLSMVLGEELKKIVGTDKEHMLFCPLAVRSHIDHVLVRDVCLAVFAKERVILWEDFPYNIANPIGEKDIAPFAARAFSFDRPEEREKKLNMIRAYKSQAQAMFPDGNIPLVPEVYYSPRKKSSRI